jgi:hypothetical protein
VKDINFSERALLLDFLTWLAGESEFEIVYERGLPAQKLPPVQDILDSYEQEGERT